MKKAMYAIMSVGILLFGCGCSCLPNIGCCGLEVLVDLLSLLMGAAPAA